VLLVDDAPENVVAARAMGMQGVVVARSGVAPSGDLPWVQSLSEIVVNP
jgi:FMN phosphatase YigB (HAD superfamily)